MKSVHLNLLDIVPFGDAGLASTETLTSLLFDAAGTPIVVFGTWFLGATTVKRLHDRNKSGWWMVPLLIAPDVVNRLQDRLPDSYAVAVLRLVAPIFCGWCFVELFCLRGRGGPTIGS